MLCNIQQKVRPSPDSNLAWWLTLARCGRSSNVQIHCHHAQMSAWQGSAVPWRLLHTGHRCCRQAASQVSLTATDGGATTSAIHYWTPSIHCARPCGLELLAGRPPCTAGLSPLDWAWKPGFSPDSSVFSALETFVIIALYKSTCTIPYHAIQIITDSAVRFGTLHRIAHVWLLDMSLACGRCSYWLSEAIFRMFACGPANATVSLKPHHLLPHLNSDLSDTGLPRLSWKRGH